MPQTKTYIVERDNGTIATYTEQEFQQYLKDHAERMQRQGAKLHPNSSNEINTNHE